MKSLMIALAFLLSSILTFGQNTRDEYSYYSSMADSLYKAKDYRNSAFTFSKAFKSLGWKGSQKDRYNAACAWALAGVADSAFYQLDNIVTKQKFMDYAHVTTDPDFNSLHQDKRWQPMLAVIKQNKEKAEANFNKALVAQLDSIYTEDQKYRVQLEEINKKFGWESKEMKAHWELTTRADSANLVKVKAILDTHGWLGADVIGAQGNRTLFLVIQHSNQATQEKYLPMMREAVRNGKAQGSSLALLEDRVALGQGKRQIYGSQISTDMATKLYYVRPLEDPDNVDERRKRVGLQPLAEYVKQWQIKWDVEQYKKDLAALEAKEGKRN
jgi:hypothetical protein